MNVKTNNVKRCNNAFKGIGDHVIQDMHAQERKESLTEPKIFDIVIKPIE